MSITINLIAKNEAFVCLVQQTPSDFLDANFNFVNRRTSPGQIKAVSMVDIVQSTVINIAIQLLKPDGSKFNLTGYNSITLGMFQRKPTQETISLTAGSVSGALTDGLITFSLSALDTNFEGFAEGSVNIVLNNEPIGFDSFQAIYRRNKFI